jgi:hypothetical protein
MQSMSIAPFTARPVASEPDSERRRARIVLALAALGIAAALFAYAVSPSVRHAVGHAAHSVNHAVSRVFDRDAKQKAHAKPGAHRVHVHAVPLHRAAPARAGAPAAPAPASAHPSG